LKIDPELPMLRAIQKFSKVELKTEIAKHCGREKPFGEDHRDWAIRVELKRDWNGINPGYKTTGWEPILIRKCEGK